LEHSTIALSMRVDYVPFKQQLLPSFNHSMQPNKCSKIVVAAMLLPTPPLDRGSDVATREGPPAHAQNAAIRDLNRAAPSESHGFSAYYAFSGDLTWPRLSRDSTTPTPSGTPLSETQLAAKAIPRHAGVPTPPRTCISVQEHLTY